MPHLPLVAKTGGTASLEGERDAYPPYLSPSLLNGPLLPPSGSSPLLQLTIPLLKAFQHKNPFPISYSCVLEMELSEMCVTLGFSQFFL